MTYRIFEAIRNKELFKSDLNQVVLILLIFPFVKKYFMFISKKGELIFNSNSFLIEYFSDVINILQIIPLFLGFYLLKSLQWKSFELKKQTKIIWICFGLLVVYKFGFNSYNFYYDQLFLFERILLLLLFVLSLFRIAFIIPFSFLFLLTISQYYYPLGGYSITDIYPLVNFFPLFTGYIFLKFLFNINDLNFWRSVIVFHISYYFISGIAKIEISPNFYEWILYNDLSNLFNSSLQMGWLKDFDNSIIILISTLISYFNVPLNLLTVLIEISSIYFLRRGKTFRIYLIVASLFHFIIYLSSGIFFWKWIIINVVIVVISIIGERESFEKVFDFKPLYFIILVLISPIYLRPLSLAWFDTKLVEKYEIYLTDFNGNDFAVTGNFFKPYDKIFSQNRFPYLTKNKTLIGTYGSLGTDRLFYSDFNLVDLINGNLNFKRNDFNNHFLIEVNNLEELEGINNYDPIRKNNFKKFLKTYLNNYNLKKSRQISLTIPHIHQPNYNFPKRIKGFKVFYKKIFHEKSGIRNIETKELINETL
jgi:hypothetical protein